MDLEAALEQFDIVEANLRRLDNVWSELKRLTPAGTDDLVDDSGVPRYLELLRAYESIVKALPPIGDCTIATLPMDPATIAQAWLGAEKVTDFDAISAVREDIQAPGREIDEYRARLVQARRELVRDHLVQAMAAVDPLLKDLAVRVPRDHERIEDEGWDRLADTLGQIERLTGSMVPRRARWRDMRRHARIGQGVDLHDIANLDWPSVRAEIEANLYSELEPLPVTVVNLLDVVRAKPSGPVNMKLNWDAINAEDFERLLYNIVKDAAGYRNAQLLTHINAPDRGRDVSAERVISDALSATRTERVIFQAKHWLGKAVAVGDISTAAAQMELWDPRPHVLIMVTTGHFTSDAVAWVEKHNKEGKQPLIEMWPDIHLEQLLAERPHLIAGFKLR